MFGNKSKALKEEFQELQDEYQICDEIVSKLGSSEKDIMSARLEITESGKQMNASISQIAENLDASAEMAHDNVEAGKKLMEQMTARCQKAELIETKRLDLDGELNQMHQACMELVESNKHYTDLSKNMTEKASELMEQGNDYVNRLDAMSELGKQMGVVALNSAIEAGRLGEAGKSFVNAAEDVRVLAGQYESSVLELKNEVLSHNEKIQSLEEEIKRLINLLKDSNIASTKLMKRSGETLQASEGLADPSLQKDMEEMKESVTKICSSQEETAKMQERNRMQLSDIEAETKTQNQYLDEIDAIMKPVLEGCVAHMQRRSNNE